MVPALVFAAALAAAPSEPVVLGRLDRPALALAFMGPDRLLVVDEKWISLWRLEASSMTLEATLEAPASAERVRHASTLIHAPEGERAWVLSTGWTAAILVGADGGGLKVESTAEALPWPRAAAGVRFRAGTSLIDGPLTGLARGPYVALAADGSAAVDAEGRLLLGARPEAEPRVGSALARPWPDLLIASTTTALAPDALLLLRPGPPTRPLARVELNGLIRALATHTDGSAGIAVAAVEDGAGHTIVRVDFRRSATRPR